MQEFKFKTEAFEAIRKKAFVKLFLNDLFVAVVLYFIFDRDNLTIAVVIGVVFMTLLYFGTVQKLQEAQKKFQDYRLVVDEAVIHCFYGDDLSWALRFDEITKAEPLKKGGMRLHDETNRRIMEIPASLDSPDVFLALIQERAKDAFQGSSSERSR